MKKDLHQIVQRLEREGLVVGREGGRKHETLVLANGARYSCARSPSDYRGLKNMERDIRRLTRLEPGVTVAASV